MPPATFPPQAQLEALREKDPEFYEYLQSTDQQLLGFGEGEADSEEEDSEGEGGSEEEEGEGAGEEEEEQQEQPSTSGERGGGRSSVFWRLGCPGSRCMAGSTSSLA